ncbi:hypothetical protein, partial [Tenuibacillus multivorans]|uniref:hypothetical protein n=1 Tax=Tenuibacillus multivorans TaxID=237069 RepID=UPI001C40BA5D
MLLAIDRSARFLVFGGWGNGAPAVRILRIDLSVLYFLSDKPSGFIFGLTCIVTTTRTKAKVNGGVPETSSISAVIISYTFVLD